MSSNADAGQTIPGGQAKTGGSGPSVIVKDLTIVGNLSSDGAIQLEGSIEGEIRCRSLEIMEGGALDGQINCDTLRVRGRVKGSIDARIVYLDETAQVRGDILHGVLNILPGAYLEGRLQRRRNEKAAQKPELRQAASEGDRR